MICLRIKGTAAGGFVQRSENVRSCTFPKGFGEQLAALLTCYSTIASCLTKVQFGPERSGAVHSLLN
jgi:hypothetical protein